MIEMWITEWKDGHQDGAQKLYDHFKAEIFRLTTSIIGNQEDAEEVTQDAFLYAFNHIHDFYPNRSSFRTWLHLIAISRSRDRLRRRQFEHISLFSLDEKIDQHLPEEYSPENGIIQSENNTTFLNQIQRLNPKLREAIILRFWAEHSYKDMAYIMRCPVPTAQSRVRLGLEKLANQLNQDDRESLDISLKRMK